jgi:hypothetical protein
VFFARISVHSSLTSVQQISELSNWVRIGKTYKEIIVPPGLLLKYAVDAGFFLAEGAGCAGPMDY